MKKNETLRLIVSITLGVVIIILSGTGELRGIPASAIESHRCSKSSDSSKIQHEISRVAFVAIEWFITRD